MQMIAWNTFWILRAKIFTIGLKIQEQNFLNGKIYAMCTSQHYWQAAMSRKIGSKQMKNYELRQWQKFHWIQDGSEKTWLMMPNEVTHFLEVSKNVNVRYAFERITGMNTDGKDEITLCVNYVLFPVKGET